MAVPIDSPEISNALRQENSATSHVISGIIINPPADDAIEAMPSARPRLRSNHRVVIVFAASPPANVIASPRKTRIAASMIKWEDDCDKITKPAANAAPPSGISHLTDTASYKRPTIGDHIAMPMSKAINAMLALPLEMPNSAVTGITNS